MNPIILQSLRIAATGALLACLMQCRTADPSVPPTQGTLYIGSETDRIPKKKAKKPKKDTAPVTPNLVNVKKVIPSMVVELRYGTSRNPLGKPIYPPGMPCLLHPETAKKLRSAQRYLAERGYGIKIWDAYRPPAIQRRLWNEGPDEGHEYIADPDNFWSQHCNGTAFDVTLVDLRGRELKMPTDFDEFTKDAAFHYTGDDPKIAKRLLTLQRAMYQAGFFGLEVEWWHFNDPDRWNTPITYAWELGIRLPKN